MDFSLIDTSISFLFGTLYIDPAIKGVDVLWNIYITVSERSCLVVMMIIWK